MQTFECKDGSPADEEWQSAEDSKAAVDKPPIKRDSAEVAGDECEWNDPGAGEQAKGDDPLVADRIDVGANKRNGDDQVSECEPVRAVGEERIKSVRVTESFVDAFDPRQEPSGLGDCMQCARMQCGNEPAKLSLERKGRHATENEP